MAISGGTIISTGGLVGIGGGANISTQKAVTTQNIVIAGGNIQTNGFAITPTNDNAAVYLTTVTLDGVADDTSISALGVSYFPRYGVNGVTASVSVRVVLLPRGQKISAVVEAVVLLRERTTTHEQCRSAN